MWLYTQFIVLYYSSSEEPTQLILIINIIITEQ